jgi:hypothetical protein
MDNQAGLREYTAGDEIRWQLTVTHDPEMVLRRVRAVFEQQDRESATAEAREANRIELGSTTPLTKDDSTSHGILEGRVLADNALGEYTCLYVEATYERRRISRFDPESTRDIRFRVVEAPVPKPRVTLSEFL